MPDPLDGGRSPGAPRSPSPLRANAPASASTFEFTPRASMERNRAGNNVARTGAEVRLGTNLVDRDLRGKKAAAPSWYFFVGADNEALVWNVADRQRHGRASLRDQATGRRSRRRVSPGRPGEGAQMSLGLVERELKFNDIGGDRDIDRKERFAAFTYTLHH